MLVTELRFSSPGWKFYSQGITVSVFGIGLAVWGVVIVAVDPWNWVGAISMLGGAISAAAGVALLLLVWFIFIYGMIKAWRDWKQFRPPAVVVDAEGAHYQAPHRPVLVSWPEIEGVHVNRAVFPKKNVTKVSLRLIPDAVLIREGLVHVPASRYLNVGLLSDTAVPEDAALAFLAAAAGTRFELTETDRRPTVRR